MAPSTLKSQWWNWVARQKIDPHLPIHGLRDSFGTWVYETYGVKQAQEWLGHSDPATTLRPPLHVTTAAQAKAVAGLDEVTRAALEAAEEEAAEAAQPLRDNVVSLAESGAGSEFYCGAGRAPARFELDKAGNLLYALLIVIDKYVGREAACRRSSFVSMPLRCADLPSAGPPGRGRASPRLPREATSCRRSRTSSASP